MQVWWEVWRISEMSNGGLVSKTKSIEFQSGNHVPNQSTSNHIQRALKWYKTSNFKASTGWKTKVLQIIYEEPENDTITKCLRWVYRRRDLALLTTRTNAHFTTRTWGERIRDDTWSLLHNLLLDYAMYCADLGRERCETKTKNGLLLATSLTWSLLHSLLIQYTMY